MTPFDTQSKMAENGRNEKASLGHFAKSQTRYGTTTKSTYTNEKYLKHTIEKGETLQGIALKYNVTTEQIKRANNMWTNDSLFLRKYVLIPLDSSLKPVGNVMNGDSGAKTPNSDSPVSPADEIITKQDLQKMSRSRSLHSQLKDKAEDQSNKPNDPKDQDVSATDFLSRFDSSLANIKDNIQRLEDSTEFPDDETNPLHHLPRRSARYGSRHKSRSVETDIDPSTEPQLAFKSRYSRQLQKASRDNMERTQDELYQL